MNKGCYRIRAEIDLDILRANFRALKNNLKPGMKACAVIKADAYGHGAAEGRRREARPPFGTCREGPLRRADT